MTPDLDHILKLARAAAPSPWAISTETDEEGVESYLISIADSEEDNLVTECWHQPSAEYIAALSPDVAIALVEELKDRRSGSWCAGTKGQVMLFESEEDARAFCTNMGTASAWSVAFMPLYKAKVMKNDP